jgi:hypothetical protein
MPAAKVVAIHQPNFFPWLGYFNKISRCDQFVVLDNVQFPKKGGTWANRVKLLISGAPGWVTMPVERNYHGVRSYAEMRIDNSTPWRDKLLQTIRTSYGTARYFDEAFPALDTVIRNATAGLTDYNLSAILSLTKALRIDVSKIVLASTLNVAGNATDLLVSTVKAVDGTAYLCGGGAGGYQEDEKFAQADIKLIYQNFKHPVYSQNHELEFIPGLSIIDALMNCGFEKTRSLVGNGSETSHHARA